MTLELENHKGYVQWYNKERGFGIIIKDGTIDEYFVHYTEIEGYLKNRIVLTENEYVIFNIKLNDGKKCAINVKPFSGNFKDVQLSKNFFRKKRLKNTTEFEPSHKEPDMRIMISNAKDKYEHEVTSRDVIIIKNLFEDNLNYYEKIKEEIYNSDLNLDDLWKSWHGDTHFIADDHLNWKENCPTFQKILTKLSEYFNMEIKATRLNYYQDSKEWKPFHHDAAAVKKDKAKTQNFTVAVSFGLQRDVAFQHAENGTVISIPAENGSVYVFSKDVNIIWKHGIRQMSSENYKNEGRFSIIAWGWREMK